MARMGATMGEFKVFVPPASCCRTRRPAVVLTEKSLRFNKAAIGMAQLRPGGRLSIWVDTEGGRVGIAADPSGIAQLTASGYCSSLRHALLAVGATPGANPVDPVALPPVTHQIRLASYLS